MRTITAFAVLAAVLMAIGVVAAELVREDPPKILFRRPVMDAGVAGEALLGPAEPDAMHDGAPGVSAREV